MCDLQKMKRNNIRNQSQRSPDHSKEKVASWPLKPSRATAYRCSIQVMKEPVDWGYRILQQNAWQSVGFHLIKCANRLKGQICKKPTFFRVLWDCSLVRSIPVFFAIWKYRFNDKACWLLKYFQDHSLGCCCSIAYF
jgi:hypothetical protein